MVAWKAERDAEVACPPGAPAISPLALCRDFRRTLLSPVLEQACEQDRLVADLCRQLVQPVEADIRIRGDEIEVPVDARFHDAKHREESPAMDGERPRSAPAACKCRLSLLRPEAHRAAGLIDRHLAHALYAFRC